MLKLDGDDDDDDDAPSDAFGARGETCAAENVVNKEDHTSHVGRIQSRIGDWNLGTAGVDSVEV